MLLALFAALSSGACFDRGATGINGVDGTGLPMDPVGGGLPSPDPGGLPSPNPGTGHEHFPGDPGGSPSPNPGTGHEHFPGDPGGSPGDPGSENFPGNELDTCADFQSDLSPLNASEVSGFASFGIHDDLFSSEVDATGLAPSVTHMQFIFSGSACPTSAADTNGDGFIDVVEELAASGDILIPLDSDLRTQQGGSFSEAGDRGVLSYEASAPFDDILTDLNAPDSDPNDALGKLNGERLDLSTRQVVLHGVSLDTPLPSTVQSLPGLPAQLTLPVACGTIATSD
jgi:hypothetical protein